MQNDKTPRTALRIILGAIALALVFVACDGDRRVVRMIGDAMVDMGRVLSDASSGDAMAQIPTCTQWEVKSVVVSTVERVRYTVAGDPDSIPFNWRYDPITLEAGWEPYGAEEGAIFVRRCVTP